MLKMHSALIVAGLAALALPASAQIFKCEGHDGRVSFSEVPCAPDAGDAEYVGEIQRGMAESSEDVRARMFRATDILREDNGTGTKVTIVPDSSRPTVRRNPATAPSMADVHSGRVDLPSPVELNDREVEYDPRQSALDRRIEQVKNKVADPRPQDGSSVACREGRPARGVVDFRGAEIWPGMTQADIRNEIGSPRSIISVLVGQEQWVYDDPDGGTVVVMINGLCVSSIR